jgi:hypothetical protein
MYCYCSVFTTMITTERNQWNRVSTALGKMKKRNIYTGLKDFSIPKYVPQPGTIPFYLLEDCNTRFNVGQYYFSNPCLVIYSYSDDHTGRTVIGHTVVLQYSVRVKRVLTFADKTLSQCDSRRVSYSFLLQYPSVYLTFVVT